jgi:hypothetical protein
MRGRTVCAIASYVAIHPPDSEPRLVFKIQPAGKGQLIYLTLSH